MDFGWRALTNMDASTSVGMALLRLEALSYQAENADPTRRRRDGKCYTIQPI